MPKITFQPTTLGLPPIKLDGKIYFVVNDTYQMLPEEKIINDRYTKGGGISRQKINTGKHRWKMTLMVPLSSGSLVVDGVSIGDVGTLSSILVSDAKVPPVDLLAYYDISTNWVFTGTKTHEVYLKIDWIAPNKGDIGVWQVPIELWGATYP